MEILIYVLLAVLLVLGALFVIPRSNSKVIRSRSCNYMLVSHHHHVPSGFWLSYLLLSSLHFSCGTSASFNFDFSEPGGYNAANFSLQGDAYFNSQALELTRNDRSAAGLKNSVGRASYMQPVAIWDEVTGEVASFTSTFTFQIELDETKNSSSGDGMAFFLAHYPSSIPKLSDGGNLGLFSRSQLPDTNATGNDRVVAVEFDTYLNKQFDTSSNHLGIDLNSLISTNYTNTTLDSTLKSGRVMTCRVSYINSTQLLAADLQIGGTRYRVDIVADLRQLLPSAVAVGFSAATGTDYELHRVLSWSFDSTLDHPPSPPAPSHHREIVGASVGCFLLVAGALVLLLYFKWWKARRTRQKPADDEKTHANKDDDTPNGKPQQDEEEPVPPHIPRRFSYDELMEATESFAQDRRLGKGGFAAVYRGDLTSPTRSVAIKRFELKDEDLRKKSFDDEITAISLVRHRYLVELLGWCKDENNLMLVYELVQGGDLHQRLHEGNTWLPWSKRYKIIIQLADALQYLHNGCPKCVVHGDIKPPNILLDSNHAVKLSDFGLARFVDHGIGPKMTSIVIGTPAYLDPEFVKNRQRSYKTDVYSFGIVLLEIVSGQQPAAVDHRQANQVTQLLIDVQDAQRRGTLLDAADSKLKAESGTDDHAQMERVLQVGLWCACLDPSQRPAIEKARSALQSWDVEIPRLSSQLEA